MNKIIIKGLSQNNLKHISLCIPKHKITVFTGVSGSGKSSIVFDTIAAESKRQLNETYPAFIRSRLPQYIKPNVESIKNLTASVVVDQKALGDNSRSTVGTITDVYSDLRLLFSRIGTPHIGTASHFSFNNPEGMCKECSGLGKVNTIDFDKILDPSKSLNDGCIMDSTFATGNWYWKQYRDSGIFDMDKPLKDFTLEEYNLLLYGSRDGKSKQEHPKVIGLYNQYKQIYLTRDITSLKVTKDKATTLIKQEDCLVCNGKRLNQDALSSKISGYSISDMCYMELTELHKVISTLHDERVTPLLEALTTNIQRMIDIGLPYLHLNRDTPSLSGGEAQRLKLVRYMGSSLSDMTYIFDEPSTGMHPHDVQRMNNLLITLRNQGNTIIVVEHDKDVIQI
ncbi:MAG: excinuclease ABC subunit UvrA, partial [Coprobacillaceae bacterium]